MTANLGNFSSSAGPFGRGIDPYVYPQFISTAMRAPTTNDVYSPGTEWQDNSTNPPTIYQTTGGGQWLTAGGNIASTTQLGEVFLSTYAQLASGTAPASYYVPSANDVFTYGQSLVLAGANIASTATMGITFLSTDLQAVNRQASTPGVDAYAVQPSNLTAVFSEPGPIGDITASTAEFTDLIAVGTIDLNASGAGATNIGGSSGAILIETGAAGFSLTGGGNSISIGSDIAANTIAIGNTTGATSLDLFAGTGDFSVNGVGATNYDIGAATTTGVIDIGGTAQTGQITLGSSSGVGTVAISDGSGAGITLIANKQTGGSFFLGTAMTNGTITIGGTAQTGTMTIGRSSAVNSLNIASGSGDTTVRIANSQTGGSVLIGGAMVGGPISIGGSTQTGAISIGPGTGVQTIGLGTGGTGIKTINIGNGAAANVVTVGSLTTSASLTLQAGTGGISLATGTAGLISVAPGTASVASPTASSTINRRVICVTFTGFTTAAAATQDFTISSTAILTTSSVLVTVANLNASTNDAQMNVVGVTQAAGSIIIHTKNNGPGALGAGDNVLVNVWVLS